MLGCQPQPAQFQRIRSLWQHVYNPDRLEIRKLCTASQGLENDLIPRSERDRFDFRAKSLSGCGSPADWRG